MLLDFRKYFSRKVRLCLGALGGILLSFSVSAQEITAIDFNGDLLGKVIPDGKVVGFDNQLIGNVTADSLIVNFDGKLIGGVIPQGVAIGNDAKLLGKVNNDGSVRLASGQVVGKVLPNGLVVNDYFDIIGAVLFPGLVYSDEGKTVGRVTGDGFYTNLQGQQIGLVTPDGYAYRRAGSDYILDGRLISSKMVVSLSGEFIGSIVPGGSVSDFDAQIIGHIKANGYAYDDQNRIIGRIVKTGYAFDNNGYYMGFVTYNGEVIENENLVGRMRADGNIVDNDGNIIGYSVDIAATATDLHGKYLGRLMPDGNLSRAKETTALVGARGMVFNAGGAAVGQISATGPVFDYKGAFRGHALPNGSMISLGGTPQGYMVNNYAYDLSGRAVGAVLNNFLAYDNQNAVLGLSGIDSSLNSADDKRIISPLGFIFNQDGSIVGSGLGLASVYGNAGNFAGQLNFRGQAEAAGGNILGNVVPSGYVVNHTDGLVGGVVKATYALNTKGQKLGHLSSQNLIIDDSMNVVGKVLPDTAAVKVDDADTVSYMPVIGQGYSAFMVTAFNGNLLGYADINGDLNDLGGSKIGNIVEHGFAVDNNNILLGKLHPFSSIINNNCEISGVVTPQGSVQNYRGIYLGKILTNGQALSDSGSIIGYSVDRRPVINYNGEVIGFVNADGHVIDADNRQLGCINKFGYLLNADGTTVGGTVKYAPVMDFNGNVIGRSILDGKVVNDDNVVIGYVLPDGSANSDVDTPLGSLLRYTVAFDLDNKFLGRVQDDGSVIADDGHQAGKLNYEGYVISDGGKVGYALYDMYVYDANGNAVGIISRKGEVVGFNNQNLGTVNRGFVVDKSQDVIARGNRDYLIRNNSSVVLGELGFDGKVRNREQQEVGTINNSGAVLNVNGETIANASPLQYYSKLSAQAKRKMIFDKDGNFVGYIDEDGNVTDIDGKIIGQVDENGNAVDKDGNIIGSTLKQKPVYDKNGNLIGYADENGTVRDANGNVIGRLDEKSNVLDANGNIIGGIGANWYERAPQPAAPLAKDDDVSPALKLLESQKFRKSLGIALTPDGEYLGEILEDGTVVDDNDNVVGHRMPDGLIIDDDGTLVGIEEVKKTDTSGMFVPPGTFGNGGAYGTGTGPAGNLGPGGGYGPGERYDPTRQAALNAAMGERRKNITVGKISNGMRKEAFDGMQKDWSEQGIGKVISSWRVDLSEMIFADKPIPAVIARAIDSNNPAPITAFVERNVYAEEGRNVIIPAGSRLMGSLGGITASSEATSESARVQISWERLIRPDGSLFVFQGLTADAQGRAGALGYVDQQLFKKYTLPIMTTSLTSATSYFMAPKDDTSTESETPRQQAANDARQNFLNEMNQIFDEILADKSNIRPMTYIPAGTRIIVFPMTDLWLRTVERDNDAQVNLEKPQILIDDGKEAAKHQQYLNDSMRRKSEVVSSEDGGDVVYDPEGGDVDAVKAAPLVSSSKKKSNTSSRAANPNYIAPPPPPSVSAPTASTNTSDNNSGVPALF